MTFPGLALLLAVVILATCGLAQLCAYLLWWLK
jgi:hypothetical protein